MFKVKDPINKDKIPETKAPIANQKKKKVGDIISTKPNITDSIIQKAHCGIIPPPF
jgi:hypothetical protein